MTSFLSIHRLARHPAQVMAAVVCLLLAVVVALGWEFGVRGLRISVQDSTEASNRTLTRVFVNENWDAVKPLLPPAGGGAEAAKANPNIAAIDQIVRRFSSYTDVLKVKIYDLSGITVYSSERKQIGEDKSRNTGFLAAARGGVASELTYRGAFGAFDGELFDRNLVSTYVPVRVGDRVEAVLEIYSDRTASIEFINRELRRLALAMVPWVLVALLLVAGVGWWLQRTQLAIAREQGLAAEEARLRAAEAAAARAGAGVLLDRLPAAFDGLASVLAHARGEALPLAAAGAVSPPGAVSAGGRSASLEELLSRVAELERWARLRTDVAGARQGAPLSVEEAFDLDALVDQVVTDATPRAVARGWQLGLYRHPSRLGLVRSHQALVGTVLTHLLDASVETSPIHPQVEGPAGVPNQGQVQWKLSFEGEALHIDVVDNGLGLPQERLDQWFQDWDLGHAVPPSDGDGHTGWRLLVVRALVQRLGGRFDARSTPGHGNRWSVDLPLAHVSPSGPSA